MHIGIITLFPEMFEALDYGIIGRAIKSNFLTLECWNPREHIPPEMLSAYKHGSVDDRPYGGGPGMVMCAGPLKAAIQHAKGKLGEDTKVIHLSPQGRLLTQSGFLQLAQRTKMILVASRYEGVDERLLETEIDEEWSIGDYVLTGGELPAMVMIDAMTRLIPGVLGHQDSASQDSFMAGLLDCPHYTRPEEYEGKQVPAVLLAGNHQAIASWRLKQALGRTWLKRPDMIQKRSLTVIEQQLLTEFICEYQVARGKHHE